MTYNVFGGTLNLTQSIIIDFMSCWQHCQCYPVIVLS